MTCQNCTEKMFPEHKCSLTLTHNPHKDYYESVAGYEKTMMASMRLDESSNPDPMDLGWVSTEQRDKAIATDSVWELQWYPHTPIGFHKLLACDLDVLLTEASRITD